MLGISPKRAGISPKGTRVPSDNAIDQFCDPVRTVVRTEQWRGVKSAITFAASALGLPERRVRAAHHGEVRSVGAWELRHVRRRYRQWCWNRQMELAQEIERLRQELRELEADEE